MNRLLVEVLVIGLLLAANGVFAMAELAVVSARKARLQQRANKGDARAQQALHQARNPNELLSTVQIGITLIGILAGAFGGATIAEEIAASFDRVSWLRPYGELLAVGLVVIVITYLSLIFGELAPKRLALYNPEGIAIRLARPMQGLAKLTRPLNRLLTLSTDAVIRLIGAHPSQEPAVTEVEVQVLIEQGTQIGVFEREEQKMIEGVLRLDDQILGGLMTPRRQVVWLDLAETTQELRTKILQSGHGRFPVIDGDEEDILGIVHTKDLLGQLLSDHPLDLTAVMREPLFVPEGTLVLDLLTKFKQHGSDMAIVIDEYGSAEGIVTHNDILEMIVGALPTDRAPEEPEITRRPDGSWLVDGMLSVIELKELLDVEVLPGEKQIRYQTLAGFILAQLGVIPTAGSNFDWEQFRFEVLDMDGNRVDKVLITPVDTTNDKE
jgi:putative hemolysin